MALAKGINSYVTRLEADAYFADRLDVDAWTSASESQKEQALITATGTLDEKAWTGVAISDTQALAFPREGNYFDPKLGYETALDGVPARILKATCELAYHLLNNDGLLDDTGSVTSLSVGSISLNIKSTPGKFPPVVTAAINPLLKNGGRLSWWRAN
jgi:hypothetical protein